MELYASGGASFACCYKLYLQKRSVEPVSPSGFVAAFGCEVSVIGTSRGRLGRSTVRVEQQPAVGPAPLAGASFFIYEYSTAIFVNKISLEIYWSRWKTVDIILWVRGAISS